MLIFYLKSLLALKSHVAQPHLGWFLDNTNQNNKNGLIVLVLVDEFWVNKNRVDSVATLPQSLGILSYMEEHASIKSKNITIPIRINIRTCGILRYSNTMFWTYNFLCMSRKLIENSLQRKLTLIYVAIEKYTSLLIKLRSTYVYIRCIRKFFRAINWLNQFSYLKESDTDYNKLMLSESVAI